MTSEELKLLKRNSARIRACLLRLLRAKKGGHVGGSLSIVEALSVLYTRYMRYDPKNPQDPDRDYLVLSKGHAGPGLYSALSVFGFFPEDELKTMNEGGTRFPSHPDRLRTPGVDATTGSLGQGISMAAGLGYALKLEGSDQYVYAIVGDGELNEGQCWEAFQFIANYRLNRVVVMIDLNKRQLDGYTRDVMEPFDVAAKMQAFGFRGRGRGRHRRLPGLGAQRRRPGGLHRAGHGQGPGRALFRADGGQPFRQVQGGGHPRRGRGAGAPGRPLRR